MFSSTLTLWAAAAAAFGSTTSTLAVPISPGKYDTLALLEKRLVINPAILEPTADTVWEAGTEVTVKWSTELLEEYPETANYTGQLLLGASPSEVEVSRPFGSLTKKGFTGYLEEGDMSEHLGTRPVLSCS